MKLCWGKIENIYLNSKGNFTDGSNTLHLLICEICLEEYLGNKKSRFCSIKCKKKYMSELFKGENNPFYGQKHTEETRNKMSKNHADFSGEKHPFYKKYYSDNEFKNNFKKTYLKLWKNRNEEWRKKFKETLSKAQCKIDHTQSYKYHNSGIHLSNKMKTGSSYYRSYWELYFMECLDINDKVIEYDYENHIIQYFDSKKQLDRHTIIDFEVILKNNTKCLVEIKPKPIIEIQQDKILGQQIYCFTNNFQYLLLDNSYFFNKEIIFKELEKVINEEKYVTTKELNKKLGIGQNSR